MIEGLVFPDTRSALFDLIDGSTHLGVTVRAAYHQQADSYGAPAGPFPEAIISPQPGGNEGFVDRVDRLSVDVYAPGEQAVRVLESIRASIVGTDIETPSGYLDAVRTVSVPTDVPYQSDTLNRASASFDVTVRPL